jgi:hypothetical protein
MRPAAHTVHHVRGRIRLKIPALKSDAGLLEEITKAISPLQGVQRVDANPSIGSVVVHYDPARHVTFHEDLSKRAESTGAFVLSAPEISEVDEVAKKIQQEAEFLSQHSETARIIVDGFKKLDRGIKFASGNAVDLKVLLPLGLAVYSFIEIGLEASTPLWVTLGIFSFNSFLSLHFLDPTASSTTAVIVNSRGGANNADRPAKDAPGPPGRNHPNDRKRQISRK